MDKFVFGEIAENEKHLVEEQEGVSPSQNPSSLSGAFAAQLDAKSKELSLRFLKICPHCQSEFAHDSEQTNCPHDGTLLAPVSSSLIGRVIEGRYTIEKLLAVGAWSEVYLATQNELGKKVAVKILHLNLVSEPDKVKRFQEEAQSVSRLHDRSIVSVHDYGLTKDGRPFMVMDYIDGISLNLATQHRRLDPFTAARYCIQLAGALQKAHEQGIIHRDIKPANIMVAGDIGQEVCHILDFGVAKTIFGEERADVTRTGEVLGTPAYMSPEQCRAQPVDVRSDVYSLGCVFHEMLTGERLVKETNTFACMKWHMTELPPEIYGESSLMPALSAIVLKMLDKIPDDRYQSMEAVAEDINNALNGVEIRIPSKRKKRSMTALLGLVAVVALLLICQSLLSNPAPPAVVPPSTPIMVKAHRLTQLENLSMSRNAQDSLESAFKLMESRILPQDSQSKEKLKYYKDLYYQKAPLPNTETPQQFVVSIVQPDGLQVPLLLDTKTVDLTFTEGPVSLILNSPYPINWNIKTKQGTQLNRIVLTGDAHSTVKNAPSDTDIIDQTGLNEQASYSPLGDGKGHHGNMDYLRQHEMSRTNYDANYSTFNAYPLSHLMNIEVGPGNDNWLAQYVTHLLRNDEELGPKFQ